MTSNPNIKYWWEDLQVGETRDLDMVKLISADGHTFFVDTKAAMVSGTIKSMLSGPGSTTQNTKKKRRKD